MSSQATSLTAPVFANVNSVSANAIQQTADKAKATAVKAHTNAKTLRQRLANFFNDAFGEPKAAPKTTINDLINAESAIGATIFGPIPAGHRREFFHHNNNVWIWYESWQDAEGDKETTIRYEVRPDGVYKRPMGSNYVKITGVELENFRRATHLYLNLIKQRLY